MRFIWLSIPFAMAVSACSSPVPDSAAGVGFGDYETYQGSQAPARAQRNAELAGQSGRAAPSANGAPTSAEIDAALNGESASGGAPASAVITPAAGGTAPVATNSDGLSREQNFDAVSDLRNIESDAALRRQQQAQYQQVDPGALPQRPADTGPNLATFALQTSNAPGEKIYRRGFNTAARHNRACAKFPSPSEAQVAFLGLGGPQRDRKGLDPDGDGFACAWDPRPFRTAGQG